METSREDVGIAIRSAFLKSGTQTRFSLLVLVIFSVILIYIETIESRPLNKVRSFIKDIVYRSATVVSFPAKTAGNFKDLVKNHISIYSNYNSVIKENNELKNKISKTDYLELENSQLRKLIEEQIESSSNLVSARVMIDKQSPYLNSFIINIGSNKNIKKGMAVLDGKNFIGRIVDVNFFSSRVLLISDLNSKISVVSSPSGNHSILSGRGENIPSLEYLPKNHTVKSGDKIYTSGKDGIFSPGIPIGKAEIENDLISVNLFSDLSQITFVNIKLEELEKTK